MNSTTLILLWYAAPTAIGEYVNGYHIQIFDNDTGIQRAHTTDNTYLLVNNLLPDHLYLFRVAAYTTADEMGPFSPLVTAALLSSKGKKYHAASVE